MINQVLRKASFVLLLVANISVASSDLLVSEAPPADPRSFFAIGYASDRWVKQNESDREDTFGPVFKYGYELTAFDYLLPSVEFYFRPMRGSLEAVAMGAQGKLSAKFVSGVYYLFVGAGFFKAEGSPFFGEGFEVPVGAGLEFNHKNVLGIFQIFLPDYAFYRDPEFRKSSYDIFVEGGYVAQKNQNWNRQMLNLGLKLYF